MSYAKTYHTLFQQTPPTSASPTVSEADILSDGRGFVEHFDLTLQLNVGCPAGCLFCYVPTSARLMPRTLVGERGERWGFFVKQKRRALERWHQHLARGRCADKVIYWSGITDPYASPAAESRGVWSELRAASPELRPRRMIVQTRFGPERDADLMAAYVAATRSSDDGPPVVISYSLGTDRNDFIAAWERATPRFERRMKTIETLCHRGLFVVVTLSPFGLWNDLPGTLRQLDKWGVSYVTVLFFKEHGHGARTPKLFLEFLRATHPLLLDAQWQAERLAEIQSVLGPHRVIAGKDGFASLARPHLVGPAIHPG